MQSASSSTDSISHKGPEQSMDQKTADVNPCRANTAEMQENELVPYVRAVDGRVLEGGSGKVCMLHMLSNLYVIIEMSISSKYLLRITCKTVHSL